MKQLGLYRRNAKDTTIKITERDVQNYAQSRLSLSCNLLRINSAGTIKKHNSYTRKDGSVNEYDSYIKTAPKGTPDLIGYHRRTGKFVACEVKRDMGKTSVLQDYFIDEVRSAGGYGFVVHTTDEVDRVAEFLEREGMSK